MSDKETIPKTAESTGKESKWLIQWYITIP